MRTKTYKIKNYKGNLVESLKNFSKKYKKMRIVEAIADDDELKIKAEKQITEDYGHDEIYCDAFNNLMNMLVEFKRIHPEGVSDDRVSVSSLYKSSPKNMAHVFYIMISFLTDYFSTTKEKNIPDSMWENRDQIVDMICTLDPSYKEELSPEPYP